MAKQRIGVLYDFWWEEDEERAEEARPRRKSPDEDVQEVYEALKKGGHSPIFLRLDGSAQSMIEIAQSETDLIFNLVESFATARASNPSESVTAGAAAGFAAGLAAGLVSAAWALSARTRATNAARTGRTRFTGNLQQVV